MSIYKMLLNSALFGDGGGSNTTIVPLDVTENGTYTAQEGEAYSPVNVNVSGYSLPYEDIKDVMFMDYDGSVLYSYDKQDFINNVTALPEGPDYHDGLTFQEWNWTLADIKDELQNGSGACCVGANYTTTDGYTHFYIDVEANTTIGVVIDQVSTNNVVIDWGDGNTSSTTLVSTTLTHTYLTSGSYEIKYENDGAAYLATNMIQVNNHSYSGYVSNVLKRVEVGNNITFYYNKSFSFGYHSNLKSISLPTSCLPSGGNVGANQFSYCYDLAGLVWPSGTKTIGALSYMSSCRAISFPQTANINLNLQYSGLSFLYIPTPDNEAIGSSNFTISYSPQLKRINAKCDSFSTANSAFQFCYNLIGNSIDEILKGSTSGVLATYLFSSCFSIKGDVNIGQAVTSIPASLLYSTYMITSVTCLGDITSVGASAFVNMYSCTEYDFTHCTSVPTLVNANAFNFVAETPNADAKIVVPDNLVASWKAASNWSTHASHIFGESDI